MQKQPLATRLRVLINRLQSSRVERTRPADNAMNFVTFGKQQLGEIRTVLPGDARDQCAFGHIYCAEDLESQTVTQAWKLPTKLLCYFLAVVRSRSQRRSWLFEEDSLC